jgi:hypothetical protein
MTSTISERASATVKRPATPVQRVCCPNCEATFDLHKIGKPRSPDQHRRFWGLVAAAFHQWPEAHEEQFATANDLRIWVTMKVGWRDLASKTSIVGMKPDALVPVVQAAIKAAGNNARVTSHKGQLCVWTPKSIRFDKMGHLQFCALNQAVEEVLAGVFGITGDELLEQAKSNV